MYVTAASGPRSHILASGRSLLVPSAASTSTPLPATSIQHGTSLLNTASAMSSPNAPPRLVDVLLVGGGPTSLVITYMLLKTGIVTLTVEQYDKTQQALYGRACMLYARSVELLDLIGVYSAIADIGFMVKDSTTFKDGKEVPARGWSFVRDAIAGNTFFEFSFSIRQKHIESALREAIQSMDSTALQVPAKLVDYTIDSTAAYPVLATIQEGQKTYHVRCKHLVGADGGRSTVRSISRISFPGTNSGHRWVRMDAVVRTDMPHSRRAGVSIESIEHGNVLWTPTDNGRTRIGFVCPPHLCQNEESPTAEAIMAEAKKAVRPFTLDFVELDWWTVYAIGQRVADKFKDGPIFLAGDAAHTHSSGAAQGMNTGIHDATNLAWKLAGVLKGWLPESVLDTYDAERRASAQHLIQLDRDIASLISGKIPSHLSAPPGADVNSYLNQVFTENASFTVGLGISYTENMLNRRVGAASTVPAAVLVGRRAPDVALVLPGAAFPRRLYELMAYSGRFWILVFAGALEDMLAGAALNAICAGRYLALKQALDARDAFTRTRAPVFAFLTISRGEGALQSTEALGEQPLGSSAYDVTGDAYAKYSIDPAEGGLVVVRPDGIVGTIAPLGATGYGELEAYFAEIVLPASANDGLRDVAGSELTVGEISLEGHEERREIIKTALL